MAVDFSVLSLSDMSQEILYYWILLRYFNHSSAVCDKDLITGVLIKLRAVVPNYFRNALPDVG
jgi:hypothetical protein